MTCTACGEHPKKCTAKDFTKAVIEIDNPEQINLFRKVVIPTSMGDDTTIPPAIGKYRNVLLVYEANNHAYLYSSDGIPTLLTSDVAQDIEQKIDAVAEDLQIEIAAREDADTALDGRLTTVEGIAATALQPEAIDKVVMTDISLNPNTSTTTVQIDGAKENLLTGATTTKNIPLPVASHTEAGIMNSSTFDAVTNNSNNISALLNGAVAITGLSANPSQSDLTTAWEAQTGLTTLMNRAGIYDVTNNKVWTYYSNDTTWYAASNTAQVTINTFTNSSEGTILGSTNVGQIFAENDGTGSVNGWDALSGAVSTNTSNITSLQTAMAGKQDKLTAGANITISPTNVISATGTSYTAGNAITIENNTINADIYPADFFTNDATNTDTGSNITLDKTIPATLKSVELYGDTEQQTYSGKNLVNTPDDTRSSGGLDIVWSDNICTFSGTASSTSAILTSSTTLDQNLPQGTYVFSIQEATTYSIRLSVLNADTSSYMNYDIPAGSTSVTININYNTISYRIAAKDWSNGDSVSGTLKQPMFEAGSAPTNYEPYVGGVPAPNPDYPQDVNVVTGEQTVKMTGKNLFDWAGLEQNSGDYANATLTEWNTNGVTITGNASTGVEFASSRGIFRPAASNTNSAFRVYLPDNATVTISADITLLENNYTPKTRIILDPGGVVGSSTTLTLNESIRVSQTFNNVAEGVYRPVFSLNSNKLKIENIQLEISSTASPFQPYQSQSYTISLGSTELCKIGDYQDYIYKSGGDWYVHKATAQTVLDGSETWTYSSTSVYPFRTDLATADNLTSSDTVVPNIITNYYIPVAWNGSSRPNYCVSVSTNSPKRLSFRNVDITSKNDFLTWLGTHNVTVYYPLATPADTKITDADLIADLNALAGAKSYLDVTNFTVTATGTNLPALLKPEAYAKSLDGIIESIPGSQVQSDWTQADTTAPDYIKNKPTLSTVATSGSYNDLTNKPTIPNITMTTNDPGEGAVLSAGELLGVYGPAPIILDYSTDEINTGTYWINGSPIYKKTVEFGAGPNATTKNVAHNIANADEFIKIEGFGRSTSGYFTPIPYVPSSSTSLMDITVNSTNITMSSSDNRSNWSFYVTLYYTKSS